MKRLKVTLIFQVLMFIFLSACTLSPNSRAEVNEDTFETSAVNAEGYNWAPMKVGAGGFITGIDMSSDGTVFLAQTDVYGLYRWSVTSNRWAQVLQAQRMPQENRQEDQSFGVYALAIAPSNSKRVYMAWNNQVFRSNNSGYSWLKTNAPLLERDANGKFRTWGPNIAVDPKNPDVVIIGANDSGPAYLSSDGGNGWTQLASLPKGRKDQVVWEGQTYQVPGAGITTLVFDPSSPVINGRTSVVYASSYKNGIYRSSNGGNTWSKLAGSPQYFIRAEVAKDGTLYGVTESEVWRYRAGSWKKITMPNACCLVSVAVSPTNANRIIAIRDNGIMWQSLNGGDSWSAPISYQASATDVPWLARSLNASGYLSPSQIMFDKTIPDRLWVAQGTGVWYSDISTNATSVTWQSRNAGIEELVGNHVIAPPGGKPVVAAWDFGTFYIDNPNTYRTRQAVSDRFNSTWSLDYSLTDPKFLVGNTTDHRGIFCGYWCQLDGKSIQAGYSTDGGQTWTPFASYPAPAYGVLDGKRMPLASKWGFGSIAVSTPDNIVWMPSFDNDPYYTLDRGRTWKKVVLPGFIQNGKTGSHHQYHLKRQDVVADKTIPGTFYIAHTGQYVDNQQVVGPAVYRSTDGGVTWSKVYEGEIAPFAVWNAKLKSVPGKAGHLFFTSGPLSGSPYSGFMHSTNGGSSWQALPNVRNVHAFGFGKAAPGSNYPTIYMAGYVNDVWGLWRSTNEGSSWRKIGDFPNNSMDAINAIDGDKNKFGWVYVAYNGSGFGYGYSVDGQ